MRNLKLAASLGRSYRVVGIEHRRDWLGSYTVLIWEALFTQAHHWRLPRGKEDFTQIKKGFRTDFATIPRFSKVFFNPWDGPVGKFALHDLHYGTEYFSPDPSKEDRSILGAMRSKARKDADDAFLYGMRKEGFRSALAYYYAVRLFGWIVWRKHKTEEVLEERLKNGTTYHP